jgi:hypothetical protein
MSTADEIAMLQEDLTELQESHSDHVARMELFMQFLVVTIVAGAILWFLQTYLILKMPAKWGARDREFVPLRV